MKKPTFLRQHHGEKVRLNDGSWRRPKGLHSKLRLKKRGHGIGISVGYKSDNKTRGKVNGLEPVIISRKSELLGIDKKTQAVVVKGSVGFRKGEEIINAALAAGLTILNYRDPKAFVEAKKKAIAEKRAKKEKSIEAKVKKAEKKPAIKESPEETTEDSKLDTDKKEKDKVLTKRQ